MYLLASSASAAEARPEAFDRAIRSDSADAFFKNGEIPTLRIEVSEGSIEALRSNPREAVVATVRDGESVYGQVAIHLKGAAGSLRSVDDRPALTLKFDRFKTHQRYRGLDKLHLNNSVQDPSYLTELLCGELFLAAGVPAARTTHAMVELNGRKLGLYVLKEGFNKTLLRRYFKNANGNLYDGGFLHDIDQPMERLSGDEGKGQSAVETLVEACQIPNPELRLSALSKTLDLDRFISFMALEMMTWHWDGYFMKQNNYRVYHDPSSNRLLFMPHGMDQMFWDPRGSLFPSPEGMVARAVMSIPALKAQYRNRASWLSTNLFRGDALASRIQEVAARIRPHLEHFDLAQAHEHDEAVKHLTRQVQLRAEYLERMLTVEPLKSWTLAIGESKPLPPWRSRTDAGQAVFRQATEGGTNTMEVEALALKSAPDGTRESACLASYRTQVLLPPGRYAFSGRVRTDAVLPVSKSARGSGAGLRISGRKRSAGLVSDQGWTSLRYEFSVAETEEEIELICDLRALHGKAVFDTQSLRLERLPEEANK